MRYTRTMMMAAAAIAALSVAGSANAQQQTRARLGNPAAAGRAQDRPSANRANQMRGPQGRGMMAGGARSGMGQGFGNPAQALLRMRTSLGLTDDQVKRLEALAASAKPKSTEADMLRARADMVEAMQGDGNLAAARTAMDRMNKIRTDRAIAQLKLRQDAQAVLTPEQKAKVGELRPRGMRAMRGPQVTP